MQEFEFAGGKYMILSLQGCMAVGKTNTKIIWKYRNCGLKKKLFDIIKPKILIVALWILEQKKLNFIH